MRKIVNIQRVQGDNKEVLLKFVREIEETIANIAYNHEELSYTIEHDLESLSSTLILYKEDYLYSN